MFLYCMFYIFEHTRTLCCYLFLQMGINVHVYCFDKDREPFRVPHLELHDEVCLTSLQCQPCTFETKEDNVDWMRSSIKCKSHLRQSAVFIISSSMNTSLQTSFYATSALDIKTHDQQSCKNMLYCIVLY